MFEPNSVPKSVPNVHAREGKLLDQDYELVPLERLRLHPRNPRKGAVPLIEESIRENGFYGAVIAQKSTGYVLAGNHRLLAAREAGLTELPVFWVDVSDERALKILLADNRTSDVGTYDEEALARLLEEIGAEGLVGTGYSEEDLAELLGTLETPDQERKGSLAERFGVPPFSVLDARQGWWQDRKRAWLSLGIESELGRGAPIGGSPLPLDREKANG